MMSTRAPTSLLYIFLAFAFLQPYFACADAGPHDFASNKSHTPGDIDLVSFLSGKAQQLDAIFADAVQLLESMKFSPSCNRIAATKLVTSCQSVGGRAGSTDTDTHVALDHLRSLYAARLAVCELSGAGTAIPSLCLPVSIGPQHKRSLFGFSSKYNPQLHTTDSVTADMLEPCLRSLESRPQWWTSYSNNRQNAMVICQASRIENEKEELIELHRLMAEGIKRLNHGLQEALQAAAEGSAQHKAFIDIVAAMQARLTDELAQSEALVKRTVTALFDDMSSGVNTAMAGLSSIFRATQMDAAALEKDVRAASTEVKDLQQTLLAVHDDTLSRSELLRSVYQQDAHAHHELSLAIRSSLESLLHNDIAKITQDVTDFDSLLEWLCTRMHLILEQEATVSERLRNFEASLIEHEQNAEGLYKAQIMQLEAIAAQSQAQKSLQANMQISQALLDKVAATAADLQAMVEEAAAKYSDPTTFTSLLGSHPAWTLPALLFSVIGALSPKVAVAILLTGSIHFLTTKIR